LPPAVELAFGRVQGAIETAEGATSVRRARSALRSGLQLLEAAGRSVRAAERRKLVDGDCGRLLRAMVHQSRVLSRQSLKRLPTTGALH